MGQGDINSGQMDINVGLTVTLKRLCFDLPNPANFISFIVLRFSRFSVDFEVFRHPYKGATRTIEFHENPRILQEN